MLRNPPHAIESAGRTRLSGIIGGLLVVLGVSVLVGWWMRLPGLVRVLPDFAPMAANTALSFVLAGGVLLMPHSDEARHMRVATTIGVALVALATAVLAEHLFGFDLGIDSAPLQAWLYAGNPNPGRMPVGAVSGFLMAGCVLILAPRAYGAWAPACVRVLTVAVAAIGVLGLAGYLLKAYLLFPEYLFAGIAIHDVVGLLLLSFGLQSSWMRFEWARKPLFARDDDRVTFVGAAILVAIALAAGIVSFAVLQDRMQSLVGDTVSTARVSRTEVFLDLVQLREANARIAATRPAVLGNLRVIHAGRDDGSNIANVRAVVEGLVNQGFAGLTYYDIDGKVVASGGVFARAPEMVVTLATPEKAELAWEGGFLLRHRIPLRDAGGQVGMVAVEQRLPILTRYSREAFSDSATGDMGVCVLSGEQIHCFPQRLSAKAFFAPQMAASGIPLPMTRALLHRESGIAITKDYRNQNVVAAYGPIGDLGIGMVIKVDSAEIFRPIREQMELALGLLFLLVAGGTLLLRSRMKPLVTRLVDAEAAARQSADALKAQARELEATNKELETFSYSVSHDLRAPLRSVDGFSQILMEDYAGRLGEGGMDSLRRVRAASQRMSVLIDDMLALSQVTRHEVHLESADLSEIAAAIMTELREGEPQREVEFIVSPGMVAVTDRHLIRIALWNLLENAWKFTARRPRARIEFGIAGQQAYFVRDDGAGFDMAYADKLFGAFQRMHGANEFKGTGIGLATVQRIIHRLGGRIWAEAAPDRGATFHFTLAERGTT